MLNIGLINIIKLIIIRMRYRRFFVADGSLKIIGHLPHIKIPGQGRINCGLNVILNSDFKGSNTALTYRCKLVTGYGGLIEIGDNTIINGACIVAYKKIKIGRNCQIASSTLIADTDFHPVDPIIRRKQVEGSPFSYDDVKKDEVILGDNVWVGWNSTILKGVQIGENSIVGAGSVVVKGIYPEGVVLAGNPAKIIKKL